jgi:NADPH-dependent ferric siderophore reductase
MHGVNKVRHELVRRQLTVRSKQLVTPRMLRIVFASDELKGFASPSPDDHIKIFFSENVMRDFTPRAWDVAAGTLTLDFALHAKGPAVEWATQCAVGDTLSIGGPRGSTLVSDDFDWYLLVGDATALPSFARRLGDLREGVPVTVIALIAGDAERQEFATRASARVQWLTSTGTLAQDSLLLQQTVEALELPAGSGFVWIATEGSIAHTLYEGIVQGKGHPKEWVKASSYWTAEAE